MSKKLGKSHLTEADKMLNKQKAWLNGRPAKLTVDNPDKTATNMLRIRVPATDVWGKPKKAAVLPDRVSIEPADKPKGRRKNKDLDS